MCCRAVLVVLCSLCLLINADVYEIEYMGDQSSCNKTSCSKDRTYIPHFLCSSSSSWSDKSYVDKTPAGSYIINSVGITLQGVFCRGGGNKQSEVTVVLNKIEIGTMEVEVDDDNDAQCICRNCGSPFTANYQLDGLAEYNFGGNNTFRIFGEDFDICLSVAIITIDYDIAHTSSASTIGGSSTISTSSTTGNNTTTGGLDPETHKLVVMGGVMLGGMLCINLLVVGGWYCWKKKGYDLLPESESPISPHQLGKAITFKDIVLAERIGRGSFGEVYRGIWLSTEVAVKKLPMEIIANPALIEEFNREVKLLRSLMHPNILQFMGSCHINPDICLITEYMPRGDLYKIIHDPAIRLDWELIKRFAIDIGRGMNYLHRSNPVIIHRDLKSHNVLIGQHWNAKVADFGLSKIIKDSVEYGKFTPCGTPKWAAPEVLRNEHYSTQADVYSFGIILWEMATRHDPFPNMSAFELIVQVGRNNLRPTLPVNLYPPLERLITSCWNDNANKRPTFEQLLQTFESL